MINLDEEESYRLTYGSKKLEPQSTPPYKLQRKNKIMLISVIFGIGIILMLAFTQASKIKSRRQAEDQSYRAETEQKMQKFHNQFRQSKRKQVGLRKILWIILQKEVLSLPALELFILNSMESVHKNSEFQVRILTIKQAYSYLSESMINRMSEIMQTRKCDIDVTEIVRLALLIQHGGVSIKIGRTILTESLNWLNQMFNPKQLPEEDNENEQKCDLHNKKEIFLFKEKQKYLDFLIAAKPDSQFLWSCFLEMQATLKYGRWPSFDLADAHQQRLETNVTRINNLLESIINVRIKLNLRSQRSTLSLSQNKDQRECKNKIISISFEEMPSLILGDCSQKDKYFLYSSRLDLNSACGQTKFLIFGQIQGYRDLVNQIIFVSSIGPIHPKSIFADFVNIKQNKKLWEPSKISERWVNFCIIGPNPIRSFNNSQKSLQYLINQTHVNWTAFYYLQTLKHNHEQDLFKKQSQFLIESKTINHEKIILLPSSEGKDNEEIRSKNIEEAIANYCPKHSIAVLMDLNQTLKELQSLQKIAKIIKKTTVFGVMLNIKKNQKIKYAVPFPGRSCWFETFNNSEKAMILNNWRVFDTDLYKVIPRQNLYNLNGQYYSFLEAQLIMLAYSCPHTFNRVASSLTLRRFLEEMALPQKLAISDVILDSYQDLTTNIQQLDNIFRFKPNALSLAYVAEDITNRQISYKKVLVFNQNTKILRSQANNKPKIPKIIHQIWVQGEIPPIRKELQQRNLAHHPNYKYYLWTYDNISSENFPFTYRLLKNLYEFDKISTYSKMAMIADLMRYEVVYKYGGFYYDMNLQLFKPLFDEWRKYRFVSATEIEPRSRYSAIQSLIGAEKQYPPLLRLLEPASVNAINIFDPLTNVVTGPYYYSQTVIERQQLSPDVLLIPYEQLFSFRDQQNQNLCEIKYNHSWWIRKSKMKQNQIHQIKKNCSSYYPYAVGLDHYIFGASWVHPRKRTRLAY